MPDFDKTKWFRDAGFGLFFHVLSGSRKDIGRLIENFNARTFTGDCALAGAKYVMLTLGQNSGYMNAPESPLR